MSSRTTTWLSANSRFSPLSFSPLAWLDASDTSTITSSGSPAKVSTWADKSGNSRNVVQSTSANQPTTGADTRNGRNVLTYSGGQLLASVAFTKAQPITIAIVGAATSFPISNTQIVGNDAITPNIFASPTSGRVWRSYAGIELVSATPTDTNWHYFTATYNGASSVLRLDGTQIASGNTGTNGYSNKRLLIGADNSTAYWSGYVAEVVVYDFILTTDQRTILESYLATKWGF